MVKGKILIVNILLLCTNLLLPAEKGKFEIYHYKINFLLISPVDVTMKITYPVKLRNRFAERLEFSASSSDIFSHVYKVNNYYESIYDPEDYSIFFAKKIIEQPSIKQTLISAYIDTSVTHSSQYSNPFSKVLRIPENTHNFFSLLMHLRGEDLENIELQSMNLEVEGVLYCANFKNLGEEIIKLNNKQYSTGKIEVILRPLYPGQKSVTDKTDIFFWKIGSENATRLLWIEKEGKRRIIKAEFCLSPARLTAELVE
jgi:hypothetical protein